MIFFFFIIFIILTLISGFWSIVLLDNPKMIKNHNKFCLAVIILGPISWLIHSIRFVIIYITPLYDKIIEWFTAEDDCGGEGEN